MADNKEYLIQNCDEGSVLISEDVICTIAAAAVMEVEGIESINANFGADIAEKLGIRNMSKGITIHVSGDSIGISCDVVACYGYDVVSVAKAVQQNVASAVSSMTGFRVERVDVNVSSISISKKNK